MACSSSRSRAGGVGAAGDAASWESQVVPRAAARGVVIEAAGCGVHRGAVSLPGEALGDAVAEVMPQRDVARCGAWPPPRASRTWRISSRARVHSPCHGVAGGHLEPGRLLQTAAARTTPSG
jgi:hypothetical protein